MTVSAWKIAQALASWQSARSRLFAEDPDLEQDEAALAELLGEETGDVENVLDRLLRASVHARDMARAAEERAKVIATRGKRYDTRAEVMRGAAFAIMEAIDKKKHELPDLTASIGKPRISVQISDEAAIPDEYWRVVRNVDKAAIRSDIENGVVITGAFLEEGLPSFTVRSR